MQFTSKDITTVFGSSRAPGLLHLIRRKGASYQFKPVYMTNKRGFQQRTLVAYYNTSNCIQILQSLIDDPIIDIAYSVATPREQLKWFEHYSNAINEIKQLEIYLKEQHD
jgi:hypothetical protein